MSNEGRSWIALAHLLRPQGRKGEVLAELLTDFPDRFKEHPRVFLAQPDFNGSESEARVAYVTASWLPVGKNKGRIVLHFVGMDTISDAESIAGLDVVVPYEERVPIDDESVYISDLAGCTVYNGSVQIGLIEDVQFPATPDGATRLEDAAPLLVVRSTQGDEVLIPFVKSFLVKIDVAAKQIEMKLPEGLLEVNASVQALEPESHS